MSMLKKVVIILLAVVDVFVTGIAIGYLIKGFNTPNVIAGREILFTGSFILTFAYLFGTIVITTVLVIFLVKWKKKKDK